MSFFIILNTINALATVAAALLALYRPALMSRSHQVEPGEVYYSRMYASRAVPLGVLAALAPFVFTGSAVQLILAAAALAQVFDALIGLSRKEWGMVAGGTIAAIIHGVCACFI